MSPKHLRRYVDEFAARWNMGIASGAQRADARLGRAAGVRLT